MGILSRIGRGAVGGIADAGAEAYGHNQRSRQIETLAEAQVEIRRLQTTAGLQAGNATFRPRAMHWAIAFTMAFGALALGGLVILTWGYLYGKPWASAQRSLWLIRIWGDFGAALVPLVMTLWLGYSPFRSMFDKGGLGRTIGDVLKRRNSAASHDAGPTPVERRTRPAEADIRPDPEGPPLGDMSGIVHDPDKFDVDLGVSRAQNDVEQGDNPVHARETDAPDTSPVQRRESSAVASTLPVDLPTRIPARLPFDRLRAELIRDEGRVLEIYPDPYDPGNPSKRTAYIGHKITPQDFEYGMPIGTPISEERGEQWYEQDVRQAIADAVLLIPGLHEMPVEAQLVIANMAFQLGREGLRGFTRAREALANRDWESASMHMLDSKVARLQSPGRWQHHAARIRALA